jgi:integrase
VKLTKAAVAKLRAPDPSGNQRLVWDDDLKGFGVLVSGRTATRSFVVQRGVNGRKRRVTITTLSEMDAAGRSVEDVRAEAAELLAKMRRGEDPRAVRRGEATLRSALADYLEARPRLTPKTRKAYETMIQQGFAPWLARPLRELSPEEVEKAYRKVKAAVAVRTARRKNPSAGHFVSEPGAAKANAALRALRSVWSFAAARDPDRVPPWPTARFRGAWFEVGRRERHVRAEDLPAFYQAVNAKNEDGEYEIGRLMRDYALLLLFTGMRRGEAASLRWSDVDFAAEVIRVSAFATKSRRRLDLPMSRPVRDLLAERRALGVESEYVFPGDGKRGHLEEPKKAFAAISKHCGFDVNPHALRSTFITVASDVPMSPVALKALVNHSLGSGDVTLGYVQLTTENLRGPAHAVGARLAELCGMQAAGRGKRARKKRASSAR